MAEPFNARQFIPAAGAQPTPVAPAGANTEDWGRAQNIVGMEFDPQENSIYRQLDIIQGFIDRDVNTQKQYGEIADTRLAGIATQLDAQLGQGVEQTKGIYDQAKQSVGGTYDEASAQIGQLGAGIQGGIAQSAKGLGVEQSLTGYMNPIDRVRAEISGIQARAAEGKAGSLANLDSLSAAFQAIGKNRQAGAQTEWAQRRSELQKGVQGAITEIQTKGMEDTLEKLGNLSDLSVQRGRALTETLAKLADARSDRELEAAKLELQQQEKAFNQMIKLRDQSLQESKFSYDQAKDQRNYALDVFKAEGEATDRNIRTSLAVGEAAKAKDASIGIGEKGLTNWMAQTQKGGTFKGTTRRFIQNLEGASALLKTDPYKTGIDLLNKVRKGENTTEQEKALLAEFRPGHAGYGKDPAAVNRYISDLVTALQVYFDKYGHKK